LAAAEAAPAKHQHLISLLNSFRPDLPRRRIHDTLVYTVPNFGTWYTELDPEMLYPSSNQIIYPVHPFCTKSFDRAPKNQAAGNYLAAGPAARKVKRPLDIGRRPRDNLTRHAIMRPRALLQHDRNGVEIGCKFVPNFAFRGACSKASLARIRGP